MPEPRPDPRHPVPPAVTAGGMMGLGVQFAASILLFLLAGHWLDGRLGTRPLLLLAGALLGAGAGFYSMYRQLVVLPKRRREREPEE
jgi:F0F1-type ATP synthase assembly protein I